jgi:hypothetical protein
MHLVFDDISLSVMPLNSYYTVELPFTPNQMLTYNSELKKNEIVLGSLLGYSKKMNRFSVSGNIQLLSVSGQFNNYNWNISVNDRVFAGLGFSRSLIDFANRGNKAFLGEELEMNIQINEYHIRSYALSVLHKLENGIEAGLAAKVYFGKSWFSIDPDISVYTPPDANYIDITAKGKGRVSVPLSLRSITRGAGAEFPVFNYLFLPVNPGLGVDISMVYKADNGLMWTASVNDLGLILWHSNTTSFEADSYHRWQGVDISGRLNLNEFGNLRESDAFVSLTDTFLNRIIIPDESAFIAISPVTIHGGVWFDRAGLLSAGFCIDAAYLKNYISANVSMLGSMNIYDKVNIYAGISLSDQTAISLPMGISYGGKGFYGSFSLANLGGIVAPGFSKTFGGGFRIGFKYIPRSRRYSFDRNMPFYRIGVRNN